MGKTTRYAELAVLQKALKSEQPIFSGRLPPKTLSHQTSPEFVESRRKEIERYLQNCAADEAVTNTKGWQSFLSGSIIPSVVPTGSTTSVSSITSEITATGKPTPATVNGLAPEPMPTVDESDEEDNLEGSVYDKLRAAL